MSEETSRSSYARSIELPPELIFKDIKHADCFALDIGGSLAKLAYCAKIPLHSDYEKRHIHIDSSNEESSTSSSRSPSPSATTCPDIKCNIEKPMINVEEETREVAERLHFIKFETKYIETCLAFINKNLLGKPFEKVVHVTGGGAYLFSSYITEKLQLKIEKEDEMECLIKGCNFLLRNIQDEVFLYDKNSIPPYVFQTPDYSSSMFPYLLVQCGSGVSIIKVEGPESFTRVGGSSIGGGTFWGLGSQLTNINDFDKMLEIAANGDHKLIDMLVEDVNTELNLPSDLIASSFGKAAFVKQEQATTEKNFKDADILRSLLIMISNNICQIAYLHACLHNLKKIYFGGYFIRGYHATMHTITYGINFWSKGEIQALFLRHEGYLGAIGAFLKGAHMKNDSSWAENYAGSSGLSATYLSKNKGASNGGITCGSLRTRHLSISEDTNISRVFKFDQLELNKRSRSLIPCPLLHDFSSYLPDVVDLTKDENSRKYWLKCFQDGINKYAEKAKNSEQSSPDACERSEAFQRKYLERLYQIQINPISFGTLTVRSLLDLREFILQEFKFSDPYRDEKIKENLIALKCFKKHLSFIDSLNFTDRHLYLIKGVLAGNVFDWGASEVTKLLESDNEFNFEKAMNCLESRPWLFDDYNEWFHKMKKKAYQNIAIFVDNSGADIILGILPLVREFFRCDAKTIILVANSGPALNDVVFDELKSIIKKVCQKDNIFKNAVRDGQLKIMESGHQSPCLDLRYIDSMLANMLIKKNIDLVILEGMGRAIHTNFNVILKCDCLKVAVLKNNWLAERFGGKMFSVVFKLDKKADDNPKSIIDINQMTTELGNKYKVRINRTNTIT